MSAGTRSARDRRTRGCRRAGNGAASFGGIASRVRRIFFQFRSGLRSRPGRRQVWLSQSSDLTDRRDCDQCFRRQGDFGDRNEMPGAFLRSCPRQRFGDSISFIRYVHSHGSRTGPLRRNLRRCSSDRCANRRYFGGRLWQIQTQRRIGQFRAEFRTWNDRRSRRELLCRPDNRFRHPKIRFGHGLRTDIPLHKRIFNLRLRCRGQQE